MVIKDNKAQLPIGPVSNGIPLNNKYCGKCNKQHSYAPANSVLSQLGDMGLLYWDCNCKSTLCYDVSKLSNKLKSQYGIAVK